MMRADRLIEVGVQGIAVATYCVQTFQARRLRGVMDTTEQLLVDDDSGLLRLEALQLRLRQEIAWARGRGRTLALALIELWPDPEREDRAPTRSQLGRVRDAMRTHENAYLVDEFTIALVLWNVDENAARLALTRIGRSTLGFVDADVEFGWAIAPDEGNSLDALLTVARTRLEPLEMVHNTGHSTPGAERSGRAAVARAAVGARIDHLVASLPPPVPLAAIDRLRATAGSRATRRRVRAVVIASAIALALRMLVPAIVLWASAPVDQRVVRDAHTEAVVLSGGARPPSSGRVLSLGVRIQHPSRFEWWTKLRHNNPLVEPDDTQRHADQRAALESVRTTTTSTTTGAASNSATTTDAPAPGRLPDVWDQSAQYERSRVSSVVAAAHEANIEVVEHGHGALVTEPPPARSGHDFLATGDVIIAVDRTAIHSQMDLSAAMSRAHPGTVVRLNVIGGAATYLVPPSGSSPLRRFGPVGFGAETLHPTARVQPRVDIAHASNPRTVGGSAGIAYALSAYMALTNQWSLLGGRDIAATGVIHDDGTVTAVDFIPQKIRGAAAAGVSVVFVPAENATTAREAAQGLGIRVVPVGTLHTAIEYLQMHSSL
jgi:hypothetical protein